MLSVVICSGFAYLPYLSLEILERFSIAVTQMLHVKMFNVIGNEMKSSELRLNNIDLSVITL